MFYILCIYSIGIIELYKCRFYIMYLKIFSCMPAVYHGASMNTLINLFGQPLTDVELTRKKTFYTATYAFIVEGI